VWIRTILYLIGRVGKERTTRHLVDALRPTVDTLDRVAAATETADRAVVAARAAVDAADNDLDEQIATLEAMLFLAVARNRKDTRYRKVFPNGLTGATRTNAGEQVRLCRRIEEVLVRDFADDASMQEASARITGTREELGRRLAAYQQAVDDRNAARTAERRARIDAGDARRIAYAELLKIFPQNLRKVRSFFRHSRANGAADAPDAPTPVTEPRPVAADDPAPA
jgi:hypothetical protein